MLRALPALVFGLLLQITAATVASAQAGSWVQVEARPTLTEARDRAAAFADRFDNVAGFSLGNGWYGIVLGPYSPGQAQTELARLRASGAIPGDSYIAFGTTFGNQFWPPEGARTEAVAPRENDAPLVLVQDDPVPLNAPDETLAEARASEAALTRTEREELQIALRWAGYYNAAIDGAFGRGTRGAMSAWQEANNHEVTGILTTGQRIELFAAYNAVLEGMGMALVQDDASGIRMELPMNVVEFSGWEPPFARFDATGPLEARVLLISQPGNQDRLFGLYEILQTLEIMPVDGPRSRRSSEFEIEGLDDDIHSYAYARLEGGAIKGFVLVWPAGDEERRSRIVELMEASFEPVDGVLNPALATVDESQSIDLVAGLEVRRPAFSRSGFFVDSAGAVLTASAAVQSCRRITLDGIHDVSVIYDDPASGLAILRPDARIAPPGVAAIQPATPRLLSDVAVSGFPFEGVLSAPSLTFGRLEDLRGLGGETGVRRLSLVAQSGDAGGPVFDTMGSVLGVLLPPEASATQLPPDVAFATDSATVLAALEAAGVVASEATPAAAISPEELTRRANAVTVLVDCWG